MCCWAVAVGPRHSRRVHAARCERPGRRCSGTPAAHLSLETGMCHREMTPVMLLQVGGGGGNEACGTAALQCSPAHSPGELLPFSYSLVRGTLCMVHSTNDQHLSITKAGLKKRRLACTLPAGAAPPPIPAWQRRPCNPQINPYPSTSSLLSAPSQLSEAPASRGRRYLLPARACSVQTPNHGSSSGSMRAFAVAAPPGAAAAAPAAESGGGGAAARARLPRRQAAAGTEHREQKPHL